ncbi:MAG: xylose isomerase [Rhodobacteraceae bacterium]|nr:xylose isomerase [Paracoccaceae bacterium]
MTDFFRGIAPLRFDPQATTDLAFRHYDPDEVVMGKRMEDHLRFAVAYWHSFAWPGGDPFGGPTFLRPWFGDDMAHAKMKADAAFEMFDILGAPFFCFHDADVRPEGATFAESRRNLEEIVDYFAAKMEASKTRLLWGTANLFSHRRWMAGAATNPDPDVYAYAAATVKSCMDATLKLGGQNYVLWGGREGYETLLNTDLAKERAHAGRFLSQVVEYKHQIGTVYGFLKDFGLEAEVKVNIEQGHAILAGHSFEHEIALAASLGILGSIDMNRNDYQSGWDTDQFPDNVPEMARAYYEILKAGGFTTGGTNFDAKLRRQSLEPEDLIAAHAGAMDVCARALKAAAALWEAGELERRRTERYAGWDTPAAKAMLRGGLTEAAARVEAEGIEPEPRSGRQERLENLWNRYV